MVADYAVNAFNAHTAALLFELGASRITASIELTLDEIGALVSPWRGDGFDVLVYGRPEGMTIEHCVLSAAFDREPTTCRDLCVQKHANVSITDPTGYTFAVATDSDCRNITKTTGIANRILQRGPPRTWVDFRSRRMCSAARADDRSSHKVADDNLAALGRGVDARNQRHGYRAPRMFSTASESSRSYQ